MTIQTGTTPPFSPDTTSPDTSPRFARNNTEQSIGFGFATSEVLEYYGAWRWLDDVSVQDDKPRLVDDHLIAPDCADDCDLGTQLCDAMVYAARNDEHQYHAEYLQLLAEDVCNISVSSKKETRSRWARKFGRCIEEWDLLTKYLGFLLERANIESLWYSREINSVRDCLWTFDKIGTQVEAVEGDDDDDSMDTDDDDSMDEGADSETTPIEDDEDTSEVAQIVRKLNPSRRGDYSTCMQVVKYVKTLHKGSVEQAKRLVGWWLKGSDLAGQAEKAWDKATVIPNANIGLLMALLKADDEDEFESAQKRRKLEAKNQKKDKKKEVQADPVLNENAVAQVVESWQQAFGKRDEHQQLVYEGDDQSELVYEVLHELPQRAIMQWWSSIKAELIERIKDADLMHKLMEQTVLPFCNTYWKMLREKKQDRIFVKQACDQPGDDRKWRWLEMTDKRFVGAAHADFKLKGVHNPRENMAHVWLIWPGRKTYNGPACVPDTARDEHRPAPYQFNEWIGLRVSHERALAQGSADHQDWIDFKDYLWNGFLQGEPDEQVKKYFCKWIVSQFVRPGYKLKVALVMYSQLNQRGKGELIKVLARLLGDTVVKQCESENALDHFNEAIAAKLLIALDEFKRCKQYNERAKIEITEPTREVNGKNDKVYTEPNCSNMAICTNEKDAVDVNVFSQRVFIVRILDGIETVLQKADGSTVNYADWKGRKWSDVHLAAGMLAWAKELDLDNWDPTVIPITEGAKLQRAAGEEKHDPVAAWWRKLVNNKARADDVTWDGWNSAAALYKLFKEDHADDFKVTREASSNWFSERFAERGFDKMNKFINTEMRTRSTFPGNQKNTSCFKLPTREFALKALDIKVRAGRTLEDEE